MRQILILAVQVALVYQIVLLQVRFITGVGAVVERKDGVQELVAQVVMVVVQMAVIMTEQMVWEEEEVGR